MAEATSGIPTRPWVTWETTGLIGTGSCSTSCWPGTISTVSRCHTNLGNHDWRLNPYAPLNPLFGTTWWYNLTAPELERIHGKGATDLIYSKSWTDWPKALLEFLGADSSAPNSMPGTSMAIVTTTESILWYLLLIN